MTMNFRFVYSTEYPDQSDFPVEKTLEADMVFDDAATWDKVLDQFIQFLGNCYGYDLTNQVSYESIQDKLIRLKDEHPDWDEWAEDEEESTEGREFQ